MGNGNDGPQPVREIEIWRLREKGGDKGKKGVKKLYWRCVYAPARASRMPDDFPHGATWEWTFSEEYEGKKKKAHLHCRIGDCVVVFRDRGQQRACHIPKKELGHTGSIYEYRRSTKGERTQLFWVRILDRKALRWKDDGPVTTAERIKRDEDRDLVLRPRFLAAVDGEEGDLLYTAHSALDRDHAEAMFRGHEQFEYKYITPDGMADSLSHETIWEVRRGVGEKVEVDQEQLRKMQADRKAFLEALEDAKGILAHADWTEDEQSVDRLKKTLEVIFPGAEPGAVAGTTIGPILGGFIMAIVDYDWDKGQAGGGIFGTVGGFFGSLQGPYEAAGLGWVIVSNAYTILKILKEPKASRDVAKLKTASANLSFALAKGTSVTITATNTLANLIAGTLPNSTAILQELSSMLGPVVSAAGFLGAGISAASAARDFRRAHKSFKRRDKVGGIIGSIGRGGQVIVERPAEVSDLPLLQSYAERKLTRRGNRMLATGVVGLFGAAGGICAGVGGLVALAGITAAANFWNPLGWVLGGVALAGGIAIAGYILYRRYHKAERHEKRAAAGRIATPEEFAKKLLDFCGSNREPKSPLYDPARDLITAFGIPLKDPEPNGTQVLDLAPTLQPDDAVERIAAHFK